MHFFLYVEACVAVNFINNFGSQFTLYSSLKHEGYLVTGSGFKLKLIIDRPELHSHVIFYAKDPLGQRKIFLNGQPSTSEAAVVGCPEFVNVFATPEQGVTVTFELIRNVFQVLIKMWNAYSLKLRFRSFI